MRHTLAALLLLAFSAPALGTDWFSHGLKPVDSGTPLREDLSAQSCRSCHEGIYQDWRKSRHRVSWTNELFKEGFQFEPQDRCIFCHAPLKEQFAEVKAKGPMPLASEGVNCTTCHVREGSIYSSHSSGAQFHAWGKDKTLKSSEFCAGCHQFNFNKTIDGKPFLTPLVVQNTYNEWREYQEKGGKKSCQNCHMPGGRHRFEGAHSARVLASGIALEATADDQGYAFVLRARDVGHRVPTGDLFRHLTLEIAHEGEPYQTIASFGRVYGLTLDQEGHAVQELTSDTSLAPFERRLIRYDSVEPIRYRLVYHYTSPRDEKRSALAPEELTRVIADGEFAGLTGPEAVAASSPQEHVD